jgi:EF hand
MIIRLSVAVLVGGTVVGLVGCFGSGAPKIPLPSLDPSGAGDAALAEYDANRDGALAGDELEKCPGLKEGLKRIDANKDGRLTAEEIAQRIRQVQVQKAGLAPLSVAVTLDGKPLTGATVSFVPEKFMGSGVKPAVGTTDEGGALQPQTEGVPIAGVQPGVFRIEVSKKDAAGTETVPARFNSDTTLGVEVGAGAPFLVQGLELSLSNRK